jgi:DNA-directed RNA polymerase specialized sigma24 family protein
MPTKAGGNDARDSGKLLAGLLAILVADREDRLNTSDQKYRPAKTEVVLASAGLSASEIASLMGKTSAAVQKAIQRGRK